MSNDTHFKRVMAILKRIRQEDSQGRLDAKAFIYELMDEHSGQEDDEAFLASWEQYFRLKDENRL